MSNFTRRGVLGSIAGSLLLPFLPKVTRASVIIPAPVEQFNEHMHSSGAKELGPIAGGMPLNSVMIRGRVTFMAMKEYMKSNGKPGYRMFMLVKVEHQLSTLPPHRMQVVSWGELAQFCHNNLEGGSKVVVQGEAVDEINTRGEYFPLCRIRAVHVQVVN